jgi:HK97 family phage prohead protease
MTITAVPPVEFLVPARYQAPQYREAVVEHIDPDEGTILMRAAPYNHEVMLDRGLFESFAPHTFSRAANAPSRVKMWHLHNGPLIGHALDVEDRDDGVWIRAKFSKTPHAEEARELASDGSLDQCSVTFRAQQDYINVTRHADGLHVRHSRAALLGVALVPHGAYDDQAFVASVREADVNREREARIAALRALTH